MAAFNTGLKAQVSIHIQNLSENTPQDAPIYFAGNINNWNSGDTAFLLEIRGDGDYWIDLPPGNGGIEYKFTRGSWETVESNGSGGFRPNRSYTYGNGDTLHLDILGWEDLDSGGGTNTTANEQVMILDDAFEIPQLGRNRRIWVYLPQDYETSNKNYPVLYMHDGQNVFNAGTSFSGEWKVDETLTQLENDGYYGIIVVAIDNGGSHRIDEYSPFTNPQYGGGEGDQYLDFIIEDLKPTIDSLFRTLKTAKHTGIMGSSMGGLISHYGHFRHPEVFGKAGIFSPSYWFSQEYISYTEEAGKTNGARLYLLAGAKESTIASGTQSMFNQLVQMGYSDEEVRMLIQADGEHSEWFWAREFEAALIWLFPNEDYGISNSESELLIYPNPTKDSIRIEGSGKMDVSIFSIEGKLLKKEQIENSGLIQLTNQIRSGQLIILVESETGRTLRKVLSF